MPFLSFCIASLMRVLFSHSWITSLYGVRKMAPLFINKDGSPVLRSDFGKVLCSVIRVCGVDPARYKGHSFRIGAATYGAEQGHSDTQITHMGRRKSDAFKNYIRISSLKSICWIFYLWFFLCCYFQGQHNIFKKCIWLCCFIFLPAIHLFSLYLFCQNAICAGVGGAPAFARALAVSLPSPSQAILI